MGLDRWHGCSLALRAKAESAAKLIQLSQAELLARAKETPSLARQVSMPKLQ
jgi:hypothetical protein